MNMLNNRLNIVVSGANGFVGKNLIKNLLNQGHKIVAVIHKNDGLTNSVKKIKYDGTFDSLKSLSNEKIDGIIHLATKFIPNHKPENINELIDANIKFGTHILELTKQLEIPFFINTVTYAQFYEHNGYNPQNLYAATKMAFENIQKYYEETCRTNFLTLELTDTYGDGDNRPKFLNLVLDAIQKGDIFNMSKGEQEINYLHIDDVIVGFLKAIELLTTPLVKKNQKFSLYSEDIFKLKDLVTKICEITKSDLKTNPGFYPYRDREIMTFKPTYPKLPNWEALVSLEIGVSKLK
jgi:CDP-paratose synthetase